jgi:hypothetical protein
MKLTQDQKIGIASGAAGILLGIGLYLWEKQPGVPFDLTSPVMATLDTGTLPLTQISTELGIQPGGSITAEPISQITGTTGYQMPTLDWTQAANAAGVSPIQEQQVIMPNPVIPTRPSENTIPVPVIPPPVEIPSDIPPVTIPVEPVEQGAPGATTVPLSLAWLGPLGPLLGYKMVGEPVAKAILANPFYQKNVAPAITYAWLGPLGPLLGYQLIGAPLAKEILKRWAPAPAIPTVQAAQTQTQRPPVAQRPLPYETPRVYQAPGRSGAKMVVY